MISEKMNEIINTYISTLNSLLLKPNQLKLLVELEKTDTSQGVDNHRANILKDIGYLMKLQGFSHKSNKHDFIYNNFLVEHLDSLDKFNSDLLNRINMANITTLEAYIKTFIDFYKKDLGPFIIDHDSIEIIDCSSPKKLGMDIYFNCEDLDGCRRNEESGNRINCCEKQNCCFSLIYNILQKFKNIIHNIENPVSKKYNNKNKCGIRIYYKRRIVEID